MIACRNFYVEAESMLAIWVKLFRAGYILVFELLYKGSMLQSWGTLFTLSVKATYSVRNIGISSFTENKMGMKEHWKVSDSWRVLRRVVSCNACLFVSFTLSVLPLSHGKNLITRERESLWFP